MFVFFDQLRQSFRFQWRGVGDQIETLNDGVPEGGGATEGMEEREAAENFGIRGKVYSAGELADICQDVAVRKGNSFRLARGARSEEKNRFVIVFRFFKTEQLDEGVNGKDLGKDDPFDDLLFKQRKSSLNEDEIAVWRPREGRDLANEWVRGDEFVEVGLFDGRLHRVA